MGVMVGLEAHCLPAVNNLDGVNWGERGSLFL